MTKTVQAVVGICCRWYTDTLYIASLCILISELILYEFKEGHNTTETTIYVKAELIMVQSLDGSRNFNQKS